MTAQTNGSPVDFPTLPEFLRQRDDGTIVVRGHRISLYLLVDRIRRGDSAEAIHEEFPTISRETVDGVLGFYQRNQSLCDEYYDWRQSCIPEISEGPTLEELRQRRATVSQNGD